MKHFELLGRVLALGALSACAPAPQPAADAAHPPAPTGEAPAAQAAAAADPDLAIMAELAARGPDTKQYPQASAVMALDRDEITLTPDGTLIEHVKSIVKILDAQRGKERFADVHIPFDRKRQKLEVAVARTVNADGAPHSISVEEIGDIVPQYLAGATMYSDVRERVVSFPAVDAGSVVELEFTRTTLPTPDAPLGGETLLADWDPVLERTVIIRAPANVAPKLQVVGTSIEPVVSEGPDGRVWTYTLRNLPDHHSEPDSPPAAAILPRLVYGFNATWAEVAERVGPRFLHAALPSPLPPSVEQQAAALVARAKTPAEKAASLFAFVAHDVRSVGVPLGAAGYEPHGPDAVLANRYGDSRDKASLLLALAAAQGISGNVVLTRTGHVPVLNAVPTVAQFDHLLVALDLDGREVWLDPSDENGQFGLAYAGQESLSLKLAPAVSEPFVRPAHTPAQSVAHVNVRMALGQNGDLDADYRYELSGYYATRASDTLRPLDGEPLARFFQSAAIGVAATALDRAHRVGDTRTVLGAISVSQRVLAPGYAPAQAQFRVVELPSIPLSLADDVPSPSLSARNDPLYVGVPRSSDVELTLQVPPGWRVAYAPPKLDGTALGIAYTSECRSAAQSVTCHDHVALDQIVIPSESYPAFREALSRLSGYDRRIVLLTRN